MEAWLAGLLDHDASAALWQHYTVCLDRRLWYLWKEIGVVQAR
jgi:hypothetical protein